MLGYNFRQHTLETSCNLRNVSVSRGHLMGIWIIDSLNSRIFRRSRRAAPMRHSESPPRLASDSVTPPRLLSHLETALPGHAARQCLVTSCPSGEAPGDARAREYIDHSAGESCQGLRALIEHPGHQAEHPSPQSGCKLLSVYHVRENKCKRPL